MRGEKILLRAYLRSGDIYHLTPAYEHLVSEARKRRLAGATVLRGIMGLGSRGILLPTDFQLLGASPVIVEFVDEPDRIAEFLQQVTARVLQHGLVTLERAAVLLYRRRGGDPHPSSLPAAVEPLSTLPAITGDKHMRFDHDGVLVRVFIGESDRWERRPLYEAIVTRARAAGLAGATVLRGAMGFGANSVLHTSKVLALSTDLPIVIEMVDSREKLAPFLPELDRMVQEGMITMESVHIYKYEHDPADRAKKAL